MVAAVTYVLQFDSAGDGFDYTVVQDAQTVSADVLDLQREFSLISDLTPYAIYPAQNPMPRGVGLVSNPDSFSDSPTNAPALFDYLRFAYGRPNQEIDTYGSLVMDHGVIISQQEFQKTSDVTEVQDKKSGSTTETQGGHSATSYINEVQNIFISTDIDVEQFAFLLLARPIPYSSKNAIDSDVYIRMANPATFPLASGTTTLQLNGVLSTPIINTEFFAGNGGLDLTWNNSSPFSYDEHINVKWVIQDTDVPPNEIIIEYWFRTAEDRVGPRLLNVSPVDSAVSVPTTSTVLFDILDYEAGIDISSMVLHVNTVLVATNDPNLIILNISDGYRVQYTPPQPFLYGDIIPVALLISDLSIRSNPSFFTWSFETQLSAAPVLVEQSPSPCATGIQRVGNIVFEVIDGGDGLVKESITMSIDSSEQTGVLLVPVVRRID